MVNKKEVQFRRFFKLTSIVTDIFPVHGARMVDVFCENLLGNKVLIKSLLWQQMQQIEQVKNLSKFLVVGDLNIGDAVITSNGVLALKKLFPHSEIDMVVKKVAGDLLQGHPDISNLYPIFNGKPFLSENDFIELSRIVNHKKYDLIINFSPMIPNEIFKNKKVIHYHSMAAELMRNEKFDNVVNNINFQCYRFVGNMFPELINADFYRSFTGAKIYLSESAIEKANEFLDNHEIARNKPVIMFNPDASAKFTRIPINYQIELLKKLTNFDCTILLGAGHVEKNIEQVLLESLPSDKREKIVIVPASMKLDTYSALIDLTDVFFTGDTGNLHLAAARKYYSSTGKSLRNNTAVFSIFGGTPPHIYGYDSKVAGYFAANQDAPSRTFIAPSPCRNISCINKLAKTCKEVRCFQSLNLDEIISETSRQIKTISGQVQENFEIVT